MNNSGSLVVVSGFSGVGKGTLMKRLKEKYTGYSLSVSATTRKPREGEVDGVSYFFVDDPAFEEMISKGELLEFAIYCDHYYGTPKAYVDRELEAGNNVVLEIEIQGAMKIKKLYPDALLLFVMPPSADVLRERLSHRGTENPQVIAARLSTAVRESEGVEKYDYMLVNDDVENCVDEMHQIIQNHRFSIKRNLKFIEQVRAELKEFAKGER